MLSENIFETHSAGGIILNPDKKIVLVEQYGQTWSLPKGHVEKNETLEETAFREIYEETGITNLKLIKKLGHYQRYRISKDGGHDKSELKNLHIYLFYSTEKQLKAQDSDISKVAWFSILDVEEQLSNKEDKVFFKSIINKIK